jgi:histidinol-phosphate/aromatic aminotransferase/cobyric acid decarboxylase-like protein
MLFAPTYSRTSRIHSSAAGSKENVIIIGSVSKTFAMTGWRIGYTLGPEALIQALVKLQSQSTSNATSIAQYAAMEAMRGSMDSVPPMLAEYAKRRKRIVEGLRSIPGITCEWPGGAFYAFPNISAHLSIAQQAALAKTARRLPRCFWRKCKSRSFRGKLSAHPATCAFPTPHPLSASRKGCGALSVFSPALKPRSDCGAFSRRSCCMRVHDIS